MAPSERPWHRYARDVVRGKIVAGELVRLACQRHLDDLDRWGQEPSAEPYWFDDDAVEHFVAFASLLRHSKGRWAGEPVVFLPWQLFSLGSLFGWKHADGRRRFALAYNQLARKNGKSTEAAVVGAFLFLEDGEPGAEVYTAATKLDQAKIIHDEAVRMFKASEFTEADEGVRIVRKNISHLPSQSKYEPLGADAGTLDGLNVHAALADEVHAWPSRKLWDVLDTATGAREQPLMFAITTAGSDPLSFCGELRDYAEKVLRAVVDDPSCFAYVAELDEGDDWRDPDVWVKANPSLGELVTHEYLARKVRRAQIVVSEQNTVRRLHLDQWTRSHTRFIDLDRWDACAGDQMPAEIEAANEGRRGWVGLDLSSRTDLTAAAIVFEPEEEDAPYPVVMRFWVPKAQVEEVDKLGVDYASWARDGVLSLVPGEVIDYGWIKAELAVLRERFNLGVLGYDPWSAQQVANDLEADGWTPISIRQGYFSISEPTKALEVATLQGRLAHGGHPVLRWNIDNLEVDTDPAANLKPRKPDHRMSHRKIDGAVALIMALHLAENRIEGEADVPSRYETEGIRTT